MENLSCDCNIIHEEVVYNTKKRLEAIKIFNDVSNFFKIIGDTTRTKILFALDNNEMCVCDIANTLGMSKSSISHQLSVLKENGIIKYHFKVPYKKKEQIRQKILDKEKDSLEWLEIEEIGTMYQVKAIKRVNNPKEENLTPRSIVAKKKGRITRIEADYGEVTAKKNDVVEKGDTLISGLIKNKDEIKTKVAAKGKVYAEVWYQVNLNLPTIYQEETKTGNQKNILEILFLDKNIFISELFKYQNSINKEKVIYHNNLIPFRISFTKKEEINIKQVTYQNKSSQKEIEQLAIKKLKQRLGNDIKILSINVLKKKTSADRIEVELFFKVEEDITSYSSLENIDITLENQKE